MIELISLAALLIVCLACASILRCHFLTGVPPMPCSAREAADVVALLRQAGLARHGVIYELGSGWGSLVIALAKAFPDAQIRGIELSPLPYWVARFRTRGMSNVALKRADFYACDLSDAHAVTCYLMIKPMPRVAALLDRMLRPGTPVVSLAFRFRDRRVASAPDSRGQRRSAVLYRWAPGASSA